ncbi:AmmeMemoRadiSam system protein B [Bifidobacterium sp. SMB2]|uniref:AmmeMemoRadiSam system protein B n=1 Tax=Bifidobacterium saimiriisciurei TaxID=2661627 RepID=A0ABX0CBR4_9BIFI|nr:MULTISPECIES: AmmeMemoRadiSam system protein B [Bifidobacterium]NEG97109.1 AmmeMemoRadiSam system protein B [Bifidobacterium sp. SMB2]NEH12551.1 AmmeMemoRadiSam system protein B [Bifidobacterium saimiriisciurei]
MRFSEASDTESSDTTSSDTTSPTSITRIRPAAVAGAFYPADPRALQRMIDDQLDYARSLLTPNVLARLPEGAPKAVIVPHAGYVYSGTTAALAYALLERGRGTIHRAVIVGPTHRVAVRGVAMSRATAFATPLGIVPIDVAGEAAAFGFAPHPHGDGNHGDGNPSVEDSPRSYDDFLNLPNDTYAGDVASAGVAASVPAPALLLNDPTHAREHAVEVQIPFLQTVLGNDVEIVPLNAGTATPDEVGDVLRALWGGPETAIIISSDLSHYHPHAYARALDDDTIVRIAALDLPIHPNRACGAYPVNGLLDVCRDNAGAVDLRFLGCCTSGDGGRVALSDDLIDGPAPADMPQSESPAHPARASRPAMADPDEAVVGYASFAMWEHVDDGRGIGSSAKRGLSAAPTAAETSDVQSGTASVSVSASDDHGPVLLGLARTAIRRHLGIDDGENDADAADSTGPTGSMDAIVDRLAAVHPWLREPGASFVTLTEDGRLRGCIGTLEAYRPLGRDVAEHAVDAASRDPRFMPVTPAEYPLLNVEVSVLSKPEPMAVTSRAELEAALRRRVDGLVLEDSRGGRRATFLPQVWDELPRPYDFVAHLLAKAGLPSDLDWADGRIHCSRYTVTAYEEPSR